MYKNFYSLFIIIYLISFSACVKNLDLNAKKHNHKNKNSKYRISSCQKIGMAGLTLLSLCKTQSLTPMLNDNYILATNTLSSTYQKDGIASFKDGSGDYIVVYVNQSNFGFVEILNQYSNTTQLEFEIENVLPPFAVITLTNNNFGLFWNLDNNTIKAGLYTKNASQIADFNITNAMNPRASQLDNDGFVVTYTDKNNLYVNIFDKNAIELNNFLITTITFEPNIVAYDVANIQNNRFALTYIDFFGNLNLNIYNNSGLNINKMEIAQESTINPYLTSLNYNGQFLLTWFDNLFSTTDSQIYDNDGNNITNIYSVGGGAPSNILIASTYLEQDNYVIIYPTQIHTFALLQRFDLNIDLLGVNSQLFLNQNVSYTSTDTINNNCFLVNAYNLNNDNLLMEEYCAEFLPSINPTSSPTIEPSLAPSLSPTIVTKPPTNFPSIGPSLEPSIIPSISPSLNPTQAPSFSPSVQPSNSPTSSPSLSPTFLTLSPSRIPSVNPTNLPSQAPSISPTMTTSLSPSNNPSISPSFSNPTSLIPIQNPSNSLSLNPSPNPSLITSPFPSLNPSPNPSLITSPFPSLNPSPSPSLITSPNPSNYPSPNPSLITSPNPSNYLSPNPSLVPSTNPSLNPSPNPSLNPSPNPSLIPSPNPSLNPSPNPSNYPSLNPLDDPFSFITTNPVVSITSNPANYPSLKPTLKPTNNPTPEFDTDFSPRGFVAVFVLLIVLALIMGIAVWCSRTNNYNRL